MINENIYFNKEKFKALIHYIISKLSVNGNVDQNIVYKMAYFSDFDFYEIFEMPISGEIYIHKAAGPVPRDFNQIKEELIFGG